MVLNSINSPEFQMFFTHVKKSHGIICSKKNTFHPIAGSDNKIYYINLAKFKLVSA